MKSNTRRRRAPVTNYAPKPGESIRLPERLHHLYADPDLYLMVLRGDCLSPEINDGDLVVASPAAEVKVGKFVVLWPKTGEPAIKRLAQHIPESLLPQHAHPESELAAMVVVEMLNPAKRLVASAARLASIHAAVGVIKPNEYRRIRRSERAKRRRGR